MDSALFRSICAPLLCSVRSELLWGCSEAIGHAEGFTAERWLSARGMLAALNLALATDSLLVFGLGE